MRPSLSPLPARLVGLALLASALAVALHVVNELGGWEKRLFDVTEEQTLPTWLNSVQFAGAALAAALAGEVAPIAVACLVAVAATARDARHALGSVRLFVAGFACLGVALVLDGASAEYMDEPWLWQPSVVVEESLELLGPLLLAVVGLAVWERGVASASTGARE